MQLHNLLNTTSLIIQFIYKILHKRCFIKANMIYIIHSWLYACVICIQTDSLLTDNRTVHIYVY